MNREDLRSRFREVLTITGDTNAAVDALLVAVEPLLADYIAIESAGGEMPSVGDIQRAINIAVPGSPPDGVRRLFAPIVSRLTNAACGHEQRAVRAEVEAATAARLRDDAAHAADVLRARVTELESRLTTHIKPDANVVKRLATIALQAGNNAGTWDAQVVLETEVCAVLNTLALMGDDVWPTIVDVAKEWPDEGLPEDGPGGWDGIVTLVLRIVSSSLKPVIGALRAEVARLKASVNDLSSGIAVRIEEERETCRDVARSIYQGNTEIPVKDAAAWYACAEFIADEIGRRS
jgi:hypothetical protein